MAALSDYTSLITSQHRQSPKFVATVSLLCQPLVDLNNIAVGLQSYFDLDRASGVQLDQTGQWLGSTRYITRGGFTTLTDPYYRLLLYAKRANNTFLGAMDQAQRVLRLILQDNPLVIRDNQNMSMQVLVGLSVDPIVMQLIFNGYLDVRPLGVQINWVLGNKIFAFDTRTLYRTGFDQQAVWFS